MPPSRHKTQIERKARMTKNKKKGRERSSEKAAGRQEPAGKDGEIEDEAEAALN